MVESEVIFEFIIASLGVGGACLTTFMYWLLAREKIHAKSTIYFGLNALGSFLIMISLIYHFDWGDLGGFVMEASWLVVSMMGVVKILSERKGFEHGS